MKKIKEFEGYKVPECTEEEVRASMERTASGTCRIKNCIYSCGRCILRYDDLYDDDPKERKERLQRYLDHCWPKKVERIAVSCKTQEEWDTVRRKAGVEYGHSYFSFSDNPVDWWYVRPQEKLTARGWWVKQEGYKIISAQEFLDEEKVNETVLDLRSITSNNEKENSMDTVPVYIAKTYENLEHALLVNKYFGAKLEDEFGDPFTLKLWLTNNKDAYLAEAQNKEKEANDKCK